MTEQTPPGAPRLSPDQVRIIALVGAGWTDGRIAREVGLSVSTVKRRLRSAGRALGTISRASLVLEAARRGLIGEASEEQP